MKVVWPAATPGHSFARKPTHMNATTTLSAILLATALNAQVSIDFSDLSATGVQLDMYLVTSPGTATEPTDGINQTWDLTSVTLQPLGTLDFTAASNTPFAASYPAANWAWAQTVTGVGTDHIYLDITSAGIEVLATGVPSDVNNYTDPKKIMQFPMTFGQSFTDAYVDIDGPGSVTWSYTGHGTAMTPLGNYPDLAKVVSTEDDLLLWNTAPLYPMVIDDGTNVLAFAPADVGIADRRAPAVQVYPSPCTDALYVDAVNTANWRITDLQGRTVQAGRFSSTSLQRIDVNALATGSYVLVLDEAGTHRTVRFSKQ